MQKGHGSVQHTAQGGRLGQGGQRNSSLEMSLSASQSAWKRAVLPFLLLEEQVIIHLAENVDCNCQYDADGELYDSVQL